MAGPRHVAMCSSIEADKWSDQTRTYRHIILHQSLGTNLKDYKV